MGRAHFYKQPYLTTWWVYTYNFALQVFDNLPGLELVEKLLRINPEHRISIQEALQDPWFLISDQPSPSPNTIQTENHDEEMKSAHSGVFGGQRTPATTVSRNPMERDNMEGNTNQSVESLYWTAQTSFGETSWYLYPRSCASDHKGYYSVVFLYI